MATKHVDVPNTNLAQFQIERMRTYGDAVAMVTIWVNDYMTYIFFLNLSLTDNYADLPACCY